MEEKVTLSGMGGQGIILLGTLIANCAMEEDRSVTLIPSYGAEMRGGLSQSYICISDKAIGSPVFACPDSAILMYQPSMDKYENSINPDGLIIYNENMVFSKPARRDITYIPVAANMKAQELGNLKAANIIMLGVWCKKRKIIGYDTVSRAIRNIFKTKSQKVTDLNLKALDLGYHLV
ncbi:MAG: 2-oxoacid:acceptor oxidoreductase family protein [bacterium]|nr:2-oxoacid:acceptor oxidoreductase family protein [bacterium]